MTLPRTSRVRSFDSVVPPSEWGWIENVQGLVDPIEGEWLAEAASHVKREHAIVEIGSHTGQSTCWMAAGSRQGGQAHIYAVDPWPDPGYSAEEGANDDPFDLKTGDAVYERFKHNIRGRGQSVWNVSYQDFITPMRMMSEDAARGWDKPIGLLFIDAIHTFEGVKRDVELWLDHLVYGGWLALNDYWLDIERTQFNGAAYVVKEILEPSGMWEDTNVIWNTWVGRKMP